MANEIQQFQYTYAGASAGKPASVTEDSKDTADAPVGDVCLCVIRANVTKRHLLVEAVEAIKNHIATSPWPPNTI